MTFQDGDEQFPLSLPETSPSLPETPPSLLEALPAPAPPRKMSRWKAVALALGALLILGVLAGGSLYVLGTRGVGPLASGLHPPTPTPGYQGPQAGSWAAFTDQSSLSFTFQVAPDRQTIEHVTIHFDAFECSFLKIDGRFDDINTWRVNGQNLPEIKVEAEGEPFEFAFRGTVALSGKTASGTWDFNIIDMSGEPNSLCSGTWNATGQ